MRNSKPPQKRLDQVRQILRLRRYALSTEKCYVFWIMPVIITVVKPISCAPRSSSEPPSPMNMDRSADTFNRRRAILVNLALWFGGADGTGEYGAIE